MYRPTIAIFSKKNLLHNLQNVRKRAPNSKIISMVKANGYGHGITSVSSVLQGHTDFLGVCSMDQALQLRTEGIKSDIILIHGIFSQRQLVIASKQNMHVAFNNKQQLQWLERTNLPLKLRTWMKINTGMCRLGYQEQDAQMAYNYLANSKKTQKPLKIVSHFACADNMQNPMNEKQIQSFKKFIKNKNAEFSLCNSAGILNYPQYSYDYVRPGLVMYGASPIDNKTGLDFGFKPIMTLKSKIFSVNRLKQGQSIGYNSRYTFTKDTTVGVIAIGYGDGYPLTAGDGTPILVKDKMCQLVGRVSMDMITVDLTNCPDACIGDQVTLWGDNLPVEHAIAKSTIHPWNAFTGLQSRVYVKWTD